MQRGEEQMVEVPVSGTRSRYQSGTWLVRWGENMIAFGSVKLEKATCDAGQGSCSCIGHSLNRDDAEQGRTLWGLDDAGAVCLWK